MLIQLSGLFQYGVRQSAEVVNQMVAVDRVLGYHDLPSEAAVTARYDDEVSTEWPQKGAISVRGLNVRYRPGLPLSLRSLTFEIPGGSRVGVVGRTGCGKSTLVQSLIRLLEAEDGQIFIDSVVSGCCADMLSHFESRLAPTVFVSSFASIAGHIQTWSLQAP
jgi:ATP-binding cassette subfamily C (CFTR/MRP) protein 4